MKFIFFYYFLAKIIFIASNTKHFNLEMQEKTFGFGFQKPKLVSYFQVGPKLINSSLAL